MDEGNELPFQALLPVEVKDLLSSTISTEAVINDTPLQIACKLAQLDVADFLLVEGLAKDEQKGPRSIGREIIEGATPLWCAASNGNLNLCKLLMKRKASINGVTKTNSSPLRAACFKGHFEIVEYLIQQGANIESSNREDHSCLMIACCNGHRDVVKYLLNSGADVNRKSINGSTALHNCARLGNLDILKMLLEHGAKFECDSSGISPLLSAATHAHSSVVEYLIANCRFEKLEVINAMELLGAAFVCIKPDTYKARHYWKDAMALRFKDEECPILKPPPSVLENYIGFYEPRTLGQVESHHDLEQMKLEALFIKERIIGPFVSENIKYIIFLARSFMEMGVFSRSLRLFQYACDSYQELELTYIMFLQDFIKLFSILLWRSQKSGAVIPPFSFQTVLHIFGLTLKLIEKTPKQYEGKNEGFSYPQVPHTVIGLTINMIDFMCRLKSHVSGYDELELKTAVCEYVNMNPRSKEGMTPLHSAISDGSFLQQFQITYLPNFEIIELLLEVGACPNAMDQKGNTPLHVAAMKRVPSPDIFMLLLKHGAHLDLRNNKRKTALQLGQNLLLPDLCPLQHINLQCLCAGTIRDFNIPYAKVVSDKMAIFLNEH